jgi:hypothetical protein
MNKRSAMMVAAGLVLTLVVGGVAVAVGMVGPSTSAAGPRTVRRQEQPKPIVKTTKRTVKVHQGGGVVAVPMSNGTSGSQGSGSNGSDDNQDQVGQNQSGDQGGTQTGDDQTDEQGTSGDDDSDDQSEDSGEEDPGDDGSSGGDD